MEREREEPHSHTEVPLYTERSLCCGMVTSLLPICLTCLPPFFIPFPSRPLFCTTDRSQHDFGDRLGQWCPPPALSGAMIRSQSDCYRDFLLGQIADRCACRQRQGRAAHATLQKCFPLPILHSRVRPIETAKFKSLTERDDAASAKVHTAKESGKHPAPSCRGVCWLQSVL